MGQLECLVESQNSSDSEEASRPGGISVRKSKTPKSLQLWQDATELCNPHQTQTSHLWDSMDTRKEVKKHHFLTLKALMICFRTGRTATIVQPCPFPPLSLNTIEWKPSAWPEKTWTMQHLRADVGARSNFKSKHLIVFGSRMRGKAFFPFHISGARLWCQCTPAVNQGLIYAWQQLWMLNEDPLHVHAHT